MPTSPLERLKLGAVELNDESRFTVESLTFTPAAKKPLFATNADSDGEALVRESHYTNANFELKVRISPQSTVALGIAKLGELTDAIQACEKIEGGQALEWTPATTAAAYTGYVLSAEVTGIPIEVEGDGAGWLLGAPVVTIKLTCRPFFYTPERTVLAAVESGAEPLQVRYISGVKGDVPAEARLIVKDTATQDRRFAQWGRDVVISEMNPPLILSAKSGLTGTGFSGESKTRSGAYLEEKVLRGTAVSQATTLCGTGRIEHVGSYGIYLRVFATSAAARFRISYRNGDGPLIPLEWKQPTVVNGWADIFMGEVSLDAVKLGTQTSEVRVEQKATTGRPANDVNFLLLMPTTEASGYGRGVVSSLTTALIAYDNFEGAAGNLESQALGYPTTTTWAMINKTGENGLKVNASHYAERVKVSDASLDVGCFAFAGTSKFSDVIVSAYVEASEYTKGKLRQGVLARAQATEAANNCLFGVVEQELDSESYLRNYLRVIKRIGGVSTVLGSAPIGGTSTASGLLSSGNPFRIVLTINGSGAWSAAAYVGGPAGAVRGIGGAAISGSTTPIAELAGQDPAFATGGSLAEGKVGLYDAWTSASANSRAYDGFEVVGAEVSGRVCYSGKQVEFNSQGCLRQDSTGTYEGPPPVYRGAGFYLEPAGELGLINRMAVRMRRTDIAVEEDTVAIDKQSVEIKVTERYLVPR